MTSLQDKQYSQTKSGKCLWHCVIKSCAHICSHLQRLLYMTSVQLQNEMAKSLWVCVFTSPTVWPQLSKRVFCGWIGQGQGVVDIHRNSVLMVRWNSISAVSQNSHTVHLYLCHPPTLTQWWHPNLGQKSLTDTWEPKWRAKTTQTNESKCSTIQCPSHIQ